GLDMTLLGDLSGDGTTEIAVGVYDDDGGLNRGALWILSLTSDGSVARHQKISSTTGWPGSPIQNSDLFGTIGMDAAGDVDGDGVNDLFVSAYLDNDFGSVYLLYLNADGTVKGYEKINGSDVEGVELYDRIGISVANVGDINRDGNIDLVVGTITDGDGGSEKGAFYTLFNVPQPVYESAGDLDGDGIDERFRTTIDNDDEVGITLLRSLQPKQNIMIHETPLAGVVQELAVSFGDYDSDGKADAAVLQTWTSNGEPIDGTVFVFLDILQHSGTIELSSADYSIESSASTDVLTALLNGNFLDLNADGFDDLIVGSAGFDQTSNTISVDAGQVYLIYGSGNRNILPSDGYGFLANRSISGSGDFLVDRSTGSPEQFTLAPIDSDSGETWYQFTLLGDGLPGDSIEIGPRPLPTKSLGAVAAGTVDTLTKGVVADADTITIGPHSVGILEYDLSGLISTIVEDQGAIENATFNLDYSATLLNYPSSFKLAPTDAERAQFGKTSAAIGRTLYFSADDTFWKTDGDAVSTIPITDSEGGRIYYPHHLTVVDEGATQSLYFFGARDALGDVESSYLWKLAEGQTEAVQVGVESYNVSSDVEPIAAGGFLFFSADQLTGDSAAEVGNELLRSNGSPAGTTRITSTNGAEIVTEVQQLVTGAMGGNLYVAFVADLRSGSTQRSVFRLPIMETDASLIDSGITGVDELTMAGDSIVYIQGTAIKQVPVGSTTTTRTLLISSPPTHLSSYRSVDGDNLVLFLSNGQIRYFDVSETTTIAKTVLYTDVGDLGFVDSLYIAGQTVFIVTSSPIGVIRNQPFNSGKELWAIDDFSDPRAQLVADLNDLSESNKTGDSNPRSLIHLENEGSTTLYFVADVPFGTSQVSSMLYRLDMDANGSLHRNDEGQIVGLQQIKPLGDFVQPIVAERNIYFTQVANDGEKEHNGEQVNNTFADAQVIGSSYFTTDITGDVFGSIGGATATIRGTGGGYDVDMYRFHVNGTSNVMLDIDNDPFSFDTILSLFDSQGRLIALDDDSVADPGSVSGLDSSIGTIQLADGDYYVAVSRYSNFPIAWTSSGTTTQPITRPDGYSGGEKVIGAPTSQLNSTPFQFNGYDAGSPYQLHISVSTATNSAIPTLWKTDGLAEGTRPVRDDLGAVLTLEVLLDEADSMVTADDGSINQIRIVSRSIPVHSTIGGVLEIGTTTDVLGNVDHWLQDVVQEFLSVGRTRMTMRFSSPMDHVQYSLSSSLVDAGREPRDNTRLTITPQSDGVLGTVYRDDGRLMTADQSIIDLRHFDAGTYYAQLYPASPRTWHSVGQVHSGVTVHESATGFGFLMYSQQSLTERFSQSLPNYEHATTEQSNANHFVVVQFDTVGRHWFFSDGTRFHNFVPATTDILVASLNFDLDTVADLRGKHGRYEGVSLGYLDGDLVFIPNSWAGLASPGQVEVTGTRFTQDRENDALLQLTVDAPHAGQTRAVYFDPDRDWIHGGDGDDIIIGNEDLDRIFGGSGSDRIIASLSEVPAEYQGLSEDQILEELMPASETGPKSTRDIDPIIEIPDPYLHAAIARSIFARSDVPITTADDPRLRQAFHASELAQISDLDLTGLPVSDLSGAEFLTNLKTLSLSQGRVRDLQPIAVGRLGGSSLPLDANSDVNFDAKTNLIDSVVGSGQLTALSIEFNRGIGDYSPLQSMTELQFLSLDSSPISLQSSIFAAVDGHDELRYLSLAGQPQRTFFTTNGPKFGSIAADGTWEIYGDLPTSSYHTILEYSPDGRLFAFNYWETGLWGEVNQISGDFTPIGDLYATFPDGYLSSLNQFEVGFGPDGRLWVSTVVGSPGRNVLGTLDLETGQFNEVAETTELIQSFDSGPDGNLYYTQREAAGLTGIVPFGIVLDDGTLRPIGPGLDIGNFAQLEFAPDGTLYALNANLDFDPTTGSWGRVDLGTGRYTEIGRLGDHFPVGFDPFPIPSFATPDNIEFGFDRLGHLLVSTIVPDVDFPSTVLGNLDLSTGEFIEWTRGPSDSVRPAQSIAAAPQVEFPEIRLPNLHYLDLHDNIFTQVATLTNFDSLQLLDLRKNSVSNTESLLGQTVIDNGDSYYSESDVKIVVADYQRDFLANASGAVAGEVAEFAATTGWRYLWNANGPIDDPANYEPLRYNGELFDFNGLPGIPDALPLSYGNLSTSGGHPGKGASQISGDVDHYVIAAYKVRESGHYSIVDAEIGALASIDVRISVSGGDAIFEQTLPNFTNSAPVNFSTNLGFLSANDTIYVAVGPNNEDFADGFDWNFRIVRNGVNGSANPNAFDGDYRILPGQQSASATYTFSQVEAGEYRLLATWPEHESRTYLATYVVTSAPPSEFADGDINVDENSIRIAGHSFQSGDAIFLTNDSESLGGLTSGTTYFAIVYDSQPNQLKLATSRERAIQGMGIDLTEVSTGSFLPAYVVNQRFAPQGETLGNRPWELLDEVIEITNSGDHFELTLVGGPDGNLVADAVRLQRAVLPSLQTLDLRSNPLDNAAHEYVLNGLQSTRPGGFHGLMDFVETLTSEGVLWDDYPPPQIVTPVDVITVSPGHGTSFVIDTTGGQNLSVTLADPGVNVSLRDLTASVNLPVRPRTIDLGSLIAGRGTTILGVDSSDLAGVSVSDAGDVNGDGFDDLLIGAYGADAMGDSKSSAGESYIIFGGPLMPATIDLANLGSAGITIYGAEFADNSGTSVSGAGDVNGDGFDDLLIGADYADALGNAKSNAGESYVIFGGAALPATIDLANLGSAGITVFGADSFDNSGVAVSGAGDVNGDGFDDLLIGAYGADAFGNSKSNAGESYLIFGGSTMPATIDLANLGSLGITIVGIDSYDASGISVSGAGDVNGDGFDDLLVGAYEADALGNTKSSAGESYIIFGGSLMPTAIDLANLGSAGITIVGVDSYDLSGLSVRDAGDVNGDGFDDVLVGAQYADAFGNVKSDAGESYIIFGGTELPATIDLANLGSIGITIFGAEAGDSSGISVSGAGDVNGDGFDDLVIGAFWAEAANNSKIQAGESYVLFGRTTFPATIDLANPEEVGITVFGATIGDLSGISVNGAGDINGDGFDDVLIGAFFAYSDKGASYVIYGGDFTGSVTQLGSRSADVLVGDPLANVMIGGTGDDTLISLGGEDVLRGGEGDDVLAISDLSFVKVVGGNGVDTLRLDASSLALDLTRIAANAIQGIERIDLGRFGYNTLRLTVGEVLGISDESNSLTVLGDTSSRVQLDADWLKGIDETIDGTTFVVYTNLAASVKIQEGIDVHVATYSSINLGILDSSNGFRIPGVRTDGRFGESVSSAGDFNGDGYDDFIVSSRGSSGAGENYVIFGHGGGYVASFDLTSLDGSNGFRLDGIDANDMSYASISNAGDVNGDGFTDLIIGASGADPNGKNGAGESYVVFGRGDVASARVDLSALDGIIGFRLNGIDGNDFSGRTVSGAGDINGDGFDDLIVGADGADPNGNIDAGESYVVLGHGGTYSPTLELSSLNG
ncbi:MAG: DVUA0089 family protein, partial [Planctomycetales bacterium]|nr:DVUA0089 family protein [Planctomycetales bacterium]